MDVAIRTLELSHFKCHRSRKFSFGPFENTILGPTGAGKTAVYDAFCFLLLGRDSHGRADAEFRTLGRNGKPSNPYGITQVRGEFVLSDGVQWTENAWAQAPCRELRRILRQTAGGKLTTDFYVDGIPCRKSEFQEAVNEMIPESLFEVLTDPRYLFLRMDGRERTALLCDAFTEREEGDLLTDGTEFHLNGLPLGAGSLREAVTLLKRERKEICLNDLPFRISEMEGTLRQMGNEDYDAARRRRACLSGQRDQLQKGKKGSQKRLELLNDFIGEIDRMLGLEAHREACGRRLLKLRGEEQRICSRRRELQNWEAVLSQVLMTRGRKAAKRIGACLPPDLRLGFKDRSEIELRLLGIPYENLPRSLQNLTGFLMIMVLETRLGIHVPVFLEQARQLGTLPRRKGQTICLSDGEESGQLEIIKGHQE